MCYYRLPQKSRFWNFLDGCNPHDAQVGADPWIASNIVQEWLDKNPPSSVVYIVFNSVIAISAQKIYELVLGIQCSGHNSFWVIHPSLGHKDIWKFFLAGFVEETKGDGLVVSWCVQMKMSCVEM